MKHKSLNASLMLLIVLCGFVISDDSHASRLWKVEKDKQINYLLGTIHISDADVIALPQHIDSVVNNANQLVVEVTFDAASMQDFLLKTQLASGNLKQLVGPEMFSQLSKLMLTKGMPEEALIRFKPWAVAVMLSYPDNGNPMVLDLVLQQRFVAQSKPVYALESMDEQADIFDRMSMSDQVQFLESTLEQQDEMDALMKKMKTLYLAGDLDALNDLSNQQIDQADSASIRRLMVRLVDDRNMKMFDRMQSYLQKSGTVVAVGALHLPGDTGLIKQLRQSGYSVTPVNQ